MIDTSESEIPEHVWYNMKHHTPWGPEWYMLHAQNEPYGLRPVPLNWRDKYREGLEGCSITFHLTDQRWDEDEAREAQANQALIVSAPRLYAEARRLLKRAQRLWDLIETRAPHLMTEATDAWNGDEEE